MSHKYKVGQKVLAQYQKLKGKVEIVALVPLGTKTTNGPCYLIHRESKFNLDLCGTVETMLLHENFLTPIEEPFYIGQDKHEVVVVDNNNVTVGCQRVSRGEIMEVLKKMDNYKP